LIYEFKCKDCGILYEKQRAVADMDKDIICPACKSENYQRLISIPTLNRRKEYTPGRYRDKERKFDSPEDMKKHLDYET